MACFACKSRKKKCDNLRPCSRCVRLGRASRCASWKDSEQPIDFPIVFNSNSIERKHTEPIFASALSKHTFMFKAICTLSSCGLRPDCVAHIFDSVPNALIPSLIQLVCPPPSITAVSRIKSSSSSDLYFFDGADLSASEGSEDEGLQTAVDSGRWESDDVFGYLELVFGPNDTSRYRHVGMNTRYAALHGYHKEELLSRYAAGEAELQRIEIDALMFFLWTLKGVFCNSGPRPNEFYARIFVGAGEARHPLLLWVTMSNTVTNTGLSKVSRRGSTREM